MSTQLKELPKTLHMTWKNVGQRKTHEAFIRACRAQGRLAQFVLSDLMAEYLRKHGREEA